MARSIPAGRFQELLDAATAAFLEQGYRRTQIADVAARAGLAKGSVYTYVESKEALFDCVLRHADVSGVAVLPDALPLPTPPPGGTLQHLEKRLAEEGAFPALTRALARKRVTDPEAELQAVLGELYDTLARNRVAIKLLDRCALDRPELAALWRRAGREGVMALLARYLSERARRGRIRPFDDLPVATRIVLETLVFWAVHRHWDPTPQAVDETSGRATVLRFLDGALRASAT